MLSADYDGRDENRFRRVVVVETVHRHRQIRGGVDVG